MKKLLIALFCLLPCLAQAQTQKTRAALITEINANFADNTTGNITPALARATYNDMISSTAIVAATSNGDSNYTILTTDRYVYTTTTLTAARTWTLPAANALNKGDQILVADAASGVNASNTLSIVRAGTDTIDGSASAQVMGVAKGYIILATDGVSNWGIVSAFLATTSVTITSLTNSLGADVTMNNTALFFDGPSVAQGTVGTWFASGTVTISIPSTSFNLTCKLWDGTTVIAASRTFANGGGNTQTLSLSGQLATPAANIRISCKDTTNTTSTISFNSSGTSKDSTLTAIRLQ